MIQLKGQEGHAQRAMKKALGLKPTGNGNIPDWKKKRPELPGAGAPQGELPNIRALTETVDEDDRDDDRESGPTDSLATGELKATAEDEDDVDLGGDDEEDIIAQLRAKRVAELKQEHDKKMRFKALGHGEYTVVAQDEFLPAVTKSKFAVCAFFHKDFQRCKIVDKHLAIIARKHLPVRFISLDAEKSPFFTERLQIQTLPTIVMFKDGIKVDQIVGFAELGGRDDFPTEALERRLAQAGVLLTEEQLKAVQSEKPGAADDDDEEDKKPRNSIRASSLAIGSEFY